eukprot:2490376-Prymnesium_polylepis.3
MHTRAQSLRAWGLVLCHCAQHRNSELSSRGVASEDKSPSSQVRIQVGVSNELIGRGVLSGTDGGLLSAPETRAVERKGVVLRAAWIQVKANAPERAVMGSIPQRRQRAARSAAFWQEARLHCRVVQGRDVSRR